MKFDSVMLILFYLIILIVFIIGAYQAGLSDGKLFIKQKLYSSDCIEEKTFECSQGAVYKFCDRYEIPLEVLT